MEEMMGIVNLNEPEELLGELTRIRPLAAVPFAGRYRLIDFVLSNMVNSEISNVGIFIQHKYRSLMDHLRSGKEWDLARKSGGLFILPPAYSRYPMQVHRGDIENFYANLDYIQSGGQKYVLIAGPAMLTNIDYRQALAQHRQSGADITLLYSEMDCDSNDCLKVATLDVAEDGQVRNIKEMEAACGTQKVSMEMFIMETDLLVQLINEAISHGDYDFIKHCIIKNLGKYKMFGYEHKGFVGHINSLGSYFKYNMQLLNPQVWRELFFKNGLIYTKVKDEPPSKYTRDSLVSDSLVAAGCHIEGRVENSILFRGVRVHKGAYVKNSIIMQKGEIKAGAVLENVICDKDVLITAEKQLKGEANYPLVIKKGRVI